SQLDVVVDPLGARSLQPRGVVAIRKIWLIVCAPRFVAIKRTDLNDPRKNEHIFEFARKIQSLIRPPRPVAKIDFAIPRVQFAELRVSKLELLVNAGGGDVL